MSEVKLVIKGDSAGFKKAAFDAAVSMDRLQQSGEKLTEQSGKNSAAAERYIESLKKEALQLAHGELAVQHYELAKQRLTGRYQQEAEAIINSMDAHRRHEAELKRVGDTAEAVGKKIGSLISAAITAGVAMAGVMSKEIIAKTIEGDQAVARLNSTLRATQYAAGLTRKELELMVDRMEAKTFFDDDSIRKAMGTLLQFRDIGAPIFEEVLSLSADLAAHMGTDVPQAAALLGRALEDPERGLRGLAAAHIVLSAGQRDAIKTMVEAGQKGQAMAIVMGEVRRSVGGTAAEMDKGLAKSSADVRDAYEDMLKTLGKTDIIGGSAQRKMSAFAATMKDIDEQIQKTDYTRFLGFLEQSAGSFLKMMPGMEMMGNLIHGMGVLTAKKSFEEKDGPKQMDGIGEFAAASIGRINQRLESVADAAGVIRKKISEDEEKANRRAAEQYAHLKKSVDDYVVSLETEAAAIGKTKTESKAYEAMLQALKLRTDEERAAFWKRTEAALAALDAEERRLKQAKDGARDYKEIQEIEKKRTEELDRGTKVMERELEALIRRNEEFGKSRHVIEEETLAKLEATLAAKDYATSTYEEITALEKRIGIQKDILTESTKGDTMREQVKAWDKWTDKAANFFADWAMNGKKAFRSVGEDLKRFGAELLALTAKKFLLNIGANMIGGNVGAALSQAAGSAGSGTLSGSLAGGAAGWLGRSTGISGVGADIAAGWTGASQGTAVAAMEGATWATEVGATMQGVWSSVTTMLSYIPVWGWIAAAVVAIGAWIAGKHKGGPKVGGSFMGSYDAGGQFMGETAVSGTDNGRFFTPNQMDAEMRKLVGTFASGFFQALASLGGSSGALAFGLGVDNDPHGSARSRVSVSVAGPDGKPLYDQRDIEVDDKEVADRVALEIKRGILAGLQNSDLEESIKKLLNQVDAKTATAETIDGVIALAVAFKKLDDTIAGLEGGPMKQLELTLKGLKDNVANAERAFKASLDTGDYAGILNAEKTLETAIITRYQTEIEMARSLQNSIDTLKQSAYEFAMSIGQKIIDLGGSRDLSGLSMARAGEIRGSLSSDPSRRFGQVQQYVGVIDNWYSARRSEIERRFAAEQQQAQAAQNAWVAALQAQMAVNQAQISALQTELALANQWLGVLDKASKMIDDMRLTSINPLGSAGRLGMAEGDSAMARAGFMSATGEARLSAASRYMEALQRQLGLLGETHQRPSGEYQAGYNDIIRQLTEVQGVAKTESERALEINLKIAELQGVANRLAGEISASSGAIADNTSAMQAEIDALNKEAIGYYEWAEEEGRTASELATRRYEEQRDLITGGMDVDLFSAQKEAAMLDELKAIRLLLTAFSATNPNGNGSASDNGDGGSGTNFEQDGGGKSINLNISPMSDEQFIAKARRALPAIKRLLENA